MLNLATPTARNILIYTLDMRLRHQIQQQLTAVGHFSITLEQVEAILEFCQEQLPDLLILDARDARTPAYTLCQQIRAMPAHIHTPILLVARNERKAVEAMLACGANDLVRPPFVPGLLQRRVEHLLADSLLRQTLHRYESLVQNTAEAMIAATPDGIISGWNQAAERIYGWRAEEAIGRLIDDVLRPLLPYTKMLLAAHTAFTQHNQWRGEMTHHHESGRPMRVLLSILAVRDAAGTIIEYLNLIRDTTPQRQLEETLRSQESQMQSILDVMTELVLVFDKQGRHIQVPSYNHPLLITSASEMIGQTLEDILPVEVAAHFKTALQQVIDTQKPLPIAYTLTIQGRPTWFRGMLSPLTGERAVLVAHDETESRTASETLKETAARYQQLFEYANDAILLIDAQTGHIMEANRQATRSLGYSHEELLQLNISAIEVVENNTTDTLTVGLHTTGRLIMEQVYRRKNGTLIPVESSNRIVTMNGRSTILTFARDITERKRAREAEREQRLLAEALRETAAALSSTLQLDDVLELILQNLARIIPFDRASIMFIQEEDIAQIVRHQGYAPDVQTYVQHLRLDIKKIKTLAWMAEHQQPLIVYDTRTDPLWTRGVVDFTYLSYLGAPIILKGRVIGFLNADGAPVARFTAEQADRLQAFASQVALAIQNAQVYEESQRYAEQLEREVKQRTALLSNTNDQLVEQIAERRQIEEALEEERNLLRTVIDNLPDHVYVKDTQHRFMLANHALLSFMGVNQVEMLVNKSDFDYYPPDMAATYAQRERAIIQGESLQDALPNLITSPSGENRWLLGSQVPLRDARGQIIGLVGINRDISALKMAEEKLQEERNLLRTLIDTIPDLIYVKDVQSRFLLVNRAMARTLGIEKPDESLGYTEALFLDPQQAEQTMQQDRQVIDYGVPIINLNMAFKDASGDETWHLVTKLPLHDAQGNVTGLIGVNRDISELKQAEAQLQQVLTSARCLLWFAVVEMQGERIAWQLHVANEEAAQKFLPLDLSQRSYTEAWQESLLLEDRERRQQALRTHLLLKSGSYTQELRYRQADSSIRWLIEDVQIRPLTPGRWSLVGVCTDISERKKAEETLQRANDELERSVAARTQQLSNANQVLKQEILERQRAEESERHQRRLAEALSDSMAAINSSLERNQVLKRILDAMTPVIPYDAANIMLRDDGQALIVQERGYVNPVSQRQIAIYDYAAFRKVLTTQLPSIVYDTTKWESWRPLPGVEWIRSNITVPIRLNGEVIGFLNLDGAQPNQFTEDHARWLQAFADQASIAISNARLVEAIRNYASQLEQRVIDRTAELSHERAQLRAILDAMRDGVIYYDLENMPQYVNRAMIEISGFDAEEWKHISLGTTLIYAENPQEDRLQLLGRIDRSLRLQGIWRAEHLMRHKDGSSFDISLTCTEVKDEQNNRIGVVAVIRDISQGKQLEEQKKRFIADAAHELRTPIANLKVRLFLMKRQPEKFGEHFDVAMKAADWMQRLIDNLFDISRFERGIIELKREPVNLQQFITDVARLHEPEADRLGISFIFDMPAAPLIIQIDPYRMTQVISNLIGNALHYTPQEGTITLDIALDATTQDVVIKVIDTGVGIEAKHLPHVFQPFYRGGTVDNKGAGLGLSISQDIVRLHGGALMVTSQLGKGSEFIVRLPAAELERDL